MNNNIKNQMLFRDVLSGNASLDQQGHVQYKQQLESGDVVYIVVCSEHFLLDYYTQSGDSLGSRKVGFDVYLGPIIYSTYRALLREQVELYVV